MAALSLDATDSPKIITGFIAPADASHPRQSEGDIVVLRDGTLWNLSERSFPGAGEW